MEEETQNWWWNQMPDPRVVVTGGGSGTEGKIELLDALSDDSPISKFLEKRGEGIHHIAFQVDKLQAALDYLKNNGIKLIDETPKIGAEGFLIAFLHPQSTHGVLIELCQSPE